MLVTVESTTQVDFFFWFNWETGRDSHGNSMGVKGPRNVEDLRGKMFGAYCKSEAETFGTLENLLKFTAVNGCCLHVDQEHNEVEQLLE